MNEEAFFDPKGAAKQLYQARHNTEPCEPVAGTYEIHMLEQAYEVQDELIKKFNAAGHKVVGYKLGLTDPKAQAQMALNNPLFGKLVEGWGFAAGADIPTDKLIAPRVEGEVAFVFSAGIDDPDVDEETLKNSISKVLPALEICDSAFAGWPRSLFDAVADNLSSGFYVLGDDARDVHDLDFPNMTMQLFCNDEKAVEGDARQCMGSPLAACMWLVRELAERGTPIQPGDVILSGSLGPMQPIAKGDQIRLELNQLGTLECRFE
ncbi:fumarylacetoacetate hydrolase family protein [uncultured Halopseudomonas sp.]|uniref:2-keto-4-pentenoate hydratase n=1 Tax=uncultured Halopseudomonas sp. TaxID=2901193 RepID=UPI0030EB6970|tara:strand:+ start:38593 stop:39384 length:792 start_codon:yes stop_codon:yes gene_type:complete